MILILIIYLLKAGHVGFGLKSLITYLLNITYTILICGTYNKIDGYIYMYINFMLKKYVDLLCLQI